MLYQSSEKPLLTLKLIGGDASRRRNSSPTSCLRFLHSLGLAFCCSATWLHCPLRRQPHRYWSTKGGRPSVQRLARWLLGTSAPLRGQTARRCICVQSVRGITRASLAPPLRYGHQTGTCSGTSSHSTVLRVELEQPLQRRSYIQIATSR